MQVGPGTQQGTIRVLRLLKVVVGLGLNSTVNTESRYCSRRDLIGLKEPVGLTTVRYHPTAEPSLRGSEPAINIPVSGSLLIT